MKDINILVNKMKNKDIDILKFMEALTNIYAEKNNVKNCEIVIAKLYDANITKINSPAYYKKGIIYIREDVIQEGNISRIIKLVSHEWMHY